VVYDFNGRYEIKGSSWSSTAGIGLGAEYYHYVSDSFGIGCGMLVQNQRSAGDIAGSFSFIPAYISFKVRSTPTVPYKYGYAVAQIGYNIFSCSCDELSDTTGGVYYAAGFGFVYNHFVFELLWSVNRAKGKYGSADYDIEYSKYAFSAGYAF